MKHDVICKSLLFLDCTTAKPNCLYRDMSLVVFQALKVERRCRCTLARLLNVCSLLLNHINHLNMLPSSRV